MYNKNIELYKKTLKLTPRQREILVGTLLGDGHLETKDLGMTYRLKIEHSLKQQEYVDWLYDEFREWVHTSPQMRERYVHLRSVSGMYKKYWFNTLSSGALRFYAQQFYRTRKKVVPRLINKMLTPLALAVWYMDDGSIKSNAHSTVLFNTHGFGDADLRRLQEALLKKFGLKTSLRKQPEGIQIYLISETIPIFRSLIQDYIHPSLRYKLPKVWLTQLPKM